MDETVPEDSRHYALIPVSVVQNPAISDAAVRLYAALDGRITSAESARIRQDTLAADLGWSRSKVQRTLGELVAAELVESKRTSRSSRMAVRNPVRRSVDSGSSDASSVTQQRERCVIRDAADASDLTPPQINISLISNQQQSAEPAPATPTPAGLADEKPPTTDSKIRDYLEAVADACGAELAATRTVQKLLGKVKGRGITPRDLGALVAAAAAVEQDKVRDMPAWIVGYVLPAIAAGEMTETPAASRPTPTPPTAAELATATRCTHGEIDGRCPLCRRRLQPLREQLAAELPHAVIGQEYVDPDDSVEITFTVAELPDMEITAGHDGSRLLYLLCVGEDADRPAPWPAINPWRWMDLAAEKISAGYDADASPGTDGDLRLGNKRHGLTGEDLRWFISTVPAALYRWTGVRDEIPNLAPLGSEISWEGSVATVRQDGRVTAHVSVDLDADSITSASWFVDVDRLRDLDIRSLSSQAARLLPATYGRGITTEATADTLAVHMDPLTGGRNEQGRLRDSCVIDGFTAHAALQQRAAKAAPAAPINPPEDALERALARLGKPA